MIKEGRDQEQKVIDATSSLERIVPKFCTAINMAILNNKSIVLSLLYTEEDQAVLIDRIVIDIDHAQALHKTLGVILKDQEDVNDAIQN